jgi:drug/metabolite transporter (DMT)-like permease
MLGEVLDMYKIISAALIFVGVFLNNKSVSND